MRLRMGSSGDLAARRRHPNATVATPNSTIGGSSDTDSPNATTDAASVSPLSDRDRSIRR
ncbi:hypothetical protein [Dactylosporangium maewongense]|uniref:hypothetical protein n=1 Tax=Dactylosporangium maewongense TaxID=634393 RepID=UPI0031E09FBC